MPEYYKNERYINTLTFTFTFFTFLLRPRPSPLRCTKCNNPCTHQRPVYQRHVIRRGTITAFALLKGLSVLLSSVNAAHTPRVLCVRLLTSLTVLTYLLIFNLPTVASNNNVLSG